MFQCFADGATALSLLQAINRLPIQYIKFIMTLLITIISVNNALPFSQLPGINMTDRQPELIWG